MRIFFVIIFGSPVLLILKVAQHKVQSAEIGVHFPNKLPEQQKNVMNMKVFFVGLSAD